MRRLKLSVVAAVAILLVAVVHASAQDTKPLRLGIAGLSHDHVRGLLGRPPQGDITIVGIAEPNTELAERYAKQYNLDSKLFFTDLATMLESVKPEAVAAFGSIYDHLAVVKASAPRGIHVMVEKPLAVSVEHVETMQALAKANHIHLLTNYETSWYPSMAATYDLVNTDPAIGPIRKVVVHDGHKGPKEIGVSDEFFQWLTDPVQNGGGALIDFGCYGADLITWLMKGAQPLTVTAVTQQIKPDIYPKVDDEATIVVTYPGAQGIIQASWNWPFGRKDLEVYGKTGSIVAPDGQHIRVRRDERGPEDMPALAPRPAPLDNPFSYFAAVVRGTVKVADTDLASVPTNVTVVRILSAARDSAKTGKTIHLQ